MTFISFLHILGDFFRRGVLTKVRGQTFYVHLGMSEQSSFIQESDKYLGKAALQTAFPETFD